MTTTGVLRCGLVGLDASHATSFLRLLQPAGVEPPGVAGGRVVAALPGSPSADFAPSRTRSAAITATVRDEFSIPLVETAAELVDRVDVVLVTGADPRAHHDLLAGVLAGGKPTMVVKLVATEVAAAESLLELADRHSTPLLSASPHRFDQDLRRALSRGDDQVRRVDLHGPLPDEPPIPPILWYGAHLIDLLYTVLGRGCRRLAASDNGADTLVTGHWSDGRVGVLRGSPTRPRTWSVRLTRDSDTTELTIPPGHDLPGPDPTSSASSPHRHPHAGLLTAALDMARSGVSPVSPEEMLEAVAFAAAAERSRARGTEEWL